MAKIQAQAAVAQSARTAPEELAMSLVRCMGRESAIHVCKLNGWAGVLDMILSEDDGSDTPDKR